jgi:hypothetical protein
MFYVVRKPHGYLVCEARPEAVFRRTKEDPTLNAGWIARHSQRAPKPRVDVKRSWQRYETELRPKRNLMTARALAAL